MRVSGARFHRRRCVLLQHPIDAIAATKAPTAHSRFGRRVGWTWLQTASTQLLHFWFVAPSMAAPRQESNFQRATDLSPVETSRTCCKYGTGATWLCLAGRTNGDVWMPWGRRLDPKGRMRYSGIMGTVVQIEEGSARLQRLPAPRQEICPTTEEKAAALNPHEGMPDRLLITRRCRMPCFRQAGRRRCGFFPSRADTSCRVVYILNPYSFALVSPSWGRDQQRS